MVENREGPFDLANTLETAREVPMISASYEMPRRTATIALGIILALAGHSLAQTSSPVSRHSSPYGLETKAKDENENVPIMTVYDCIKIALEKQPKLKGIRASVAAAETGERGLDDARFFGQIAPDYKFRKDQASKGVQAAYAELQQIEYDVKHSVVWTYFSWVYAREQVKVASEAVGFVDHYRELVETIINDKKGNREINQLTLNELIIRLSEGKQLLLKAEAGEGKAYAALREAMGVEPTFRLSPADKGLPRFAAIDLKKELVVEYARTRRGEVTMASLVAEVTQIETQIQWAYRLRYRTETFAAAADLHSRSVPLGTMDGDYRPDALGPEMPAKLFGSRSSRTQRMAQLHERAQAVLEKTKNLVALEAENAFIDYEIAGKSVEEARIAMDRAKANYMSLESVVGQRISKSADLKTLLESYAVLAKAQASYNESIYHRVTALSALERVTAGGVQVKFNAIK